MKGRIKINVDESLKSIIYVKKIIFGILQNVVMKMVIINKYYGWPGN